MGFNSGFKGLNINITCNLLFLQDTKRNLLVESLSLRGDEEKFLGSLGQQANLNLIVPDEDNRK